MKIFGILWHAVTLLVVSILVLLPLPTQISAQSQPEGERTLQNLLLRLNAIVTNPENYTRDRGGFSLFLTAPSASGDNILGIRGQAGQEFTSYSISRLDSSSFCVTPNTPPGEVSSGSEECFDFTQIATIRFDDSAEQELQEMPPIGEDFQQQASGFSGLLSRFRQLNDPRSNDPRAYTGFFLQFRHSIVSDNNPVCLNSFEAFSYGDREESRLRPFAYPTPAWTLHTSVPLDFIPNLPMLEQSQRSVFTRVVASRLYNNQHELWVRGAVTAPNFSQSFLAIYQPGSNTWEFIPETVSDPNLFRQSYFVTPDGTVWASIQWLDNALPAMASVPVLSRFNDATRQFELVQSAPQVQVMDRSTVSGVNLRPEIVLDEAGIFWVFNINSSLYRYDPLSEVSEQQFDLTTAAPQGVYETALAPNGTIYFRGYNFAIDLSGDAVFQYQPWTNEVIPVSLPGEGWPNQAGLYVDSRNWLWIATVGYRDEAGEWHLLHTAVDEYFDNPLRSDAPHIAIPITTETSDGRLWVAQFDRGTGWLNPLTGTGCQILRDRYLVFEDIEGYVWVGYGTQGELYRYDATP